MNKVIKLALAGNPNTGKTTLFNAITGARQKVGNYPGVTVEKREGVRVYKGYDIYVYDLPGIYSLTAYSMDEVVARDFIINEKPDIVVDVLDATNIERNLYLCVQFQELNVPIVGALNLMDEAKERGIAIDEEHLSRIMRMPFLKTIGTSGIGLEALLDKVIDVVEKKEPLPYAVSYGHEIEEDVQALAAIIAKDPSFQEKYPPRWCAVKLLEKDARADEVLGPHAFAAEIRTIALKQISRIEAHFGRDSSVVVAEQRYGYIHGAVAESVVRRPINKETVTEVMDNVLMDRVFGFPIFLFILWAVFQLTFKLGEYPMRWLELLFAAMGGWISALIPLGMLNSLLVDGVIAGVGGVLSFVPLIVLLFMFISILEDSGYMARAAFIMDKFLHIFGLHGQSFLPMIIGFGCSVPAVMSARTLKSARDRIITVMVTPFMSCGAKLPVYVLLAGAFFPQRAGDMVLVIYIIGVVLALFSSWLFRATVLRGPSTPFVMELPPYRMPTFNGILWHVQEKTLRYLKKAGLVLLPASILIWAVTSFPKSGEMGDTHFSAEKCVSPISCSYAGQAGKAIEPLIAPLGFDWKIGVASITGFAAKEIVVSTLGVLYKVGGEKEADASLRQALKNDPVFNPLVAFVLMLFMLIVVPCFASLAAMNAEIGWRWVLFAICYWLLLAWMLCFTVYQSGKFLGWGI
jgi:ferrous iron transport protein B